MKKIIVLILSLSISIFSYSQKESGTKEKSTKSIDRGELLYQSVIGTDFPVSELTTIDNEVLILKSYREKLIFINFWFKSCPPCIAEMKGLKKLYDKYKTDSIIFIMISYENKNTINEIRDKYDLDFKMVSIEENIISNWEIPKGYPSNILLGKTGKIIYGRSGGKIDEEIATKEVLEVFGHIIESNLIK